MDGIKNDRNMAYTGAKPWHMKGTAVPGHMTVDEAFRLGGLDFEVELEPVYTQSGILVPRKSATVRKVESGPGIPLGVVGDRYQPIQNTAAFSFFDHAIGEGAAAIETVGTIGEGERVWMMAKIPDMVEVVPGDPMERYLLFTNSHDGSSSCYCLFTPIRVVCYNTLSAAISGRNAAQSVAIRHTASAEQRLKEAHRLMAQSHSYFERAMQAYKWLAKQDMTRLDVIEFVKSMFPSEKEDEVPTRTVNNRNTVIKLFQSGTGNDIPGVRGTRWAAFNAITEYIDHERTIKGDSDRFLVSTLGSGVGLRHKAFNYLTADA